ncbi:T9SS type B sorting domain-containing protein [Fibrella sp. WM1]|uniref:T9SS type B sorting domain-containing protein n=1 Tax=Fibrella musci TaxID=3242485 RepID=UPI0035213862
MLVRWAFVRKLLVALLLPLGAIAQELIPNGGFETYLNCPKQDNLLSEAAPWYNPNRATPDFYHTCFNTGQMDLPPHSGQGLGRLFMDLGWAEYMATPLKKPLDAGEAYQFELYISSATPTRYPSSSFGAYFSQQPLNSPLKDLLSVSGQVQVLDNSPQRLPQRLQWEQLGGCFVARGGESHVTIGNFVKLPVLLGYYYLFIDDVSLRPIRLDLGRDTTLCGRQSTLLLDAKTPGGIDYKWNTGSTATTLKVSKPGKYWVTVTTACKTLSDTITVNYSLDFSLGRDTTLCEGETMTLRVPVTGTYRWQDGSTLPTYQVRGPGTYRVQVVEAGCTVADTIQVRYVLPPRLDLGPDKQLCGLEVYTIKPAVAEGTFRWLDAFPETDRTVNASGSFRASVTNDCATVNDAVAIDYSGCECTIQAPDAFSPNADGMNDLFQPVACGDITFTAMAVYTRWGELIFQTNSAPFSWDGTYKGQRCQPAVYTWQINYKLSRPGKETVSQTVNNRILLVQ